jgi:cation diffusion facilitator family transporter
MKNNREKEVVKTSIIGILANLILVGFKTTIGLLSNSIAIISDAINNLSDVLSSVVTIIGTKLAGKAPDKEHPYGHGRIEYTTSFIVSAIVLYAGITALIESVKKIITPEEVDYNVWTLVILITSILIKFTLGTYVKRKGKKINSDALVASGSDAFNDALLSIAVLASTIIYMIFKVNIEAYVSVALSFFIIKTGYELIKESVDNMIGTRAESTLTRSIKKDINELPEVKGVFDLILTDYGPDKYLGSVHVEIDDTLTVGDIDRISRKISKIIFEKYGVILHTIGVYSINTKDEEIMSIRDEIRRIVFKHKGIIEMHGFYVDKKEKTISFDIIFDFKEENKKEIYKEIYDTIRGRYKDYQLSITQDIDVSD